MRVSGHRLSIAGMATIFTAAGAIGAASQAEAALYYWQDHDPGFYRPAYPGPQRKPKARRNNAVDKKALAAEKEAAAGAKPQGPLIISISIEQQKVRVYDSNGLFAEGPVSTGTPGHPTPMGVFSIIQKHKMHHSNIYSGAPMPFMQRITWSGVAMHQGVLPGYPASHGCIRMPAAFALKMWNWTKMGARVLVTPGDMTPAPFSHPFLITQKVVPVAQENRRRRRSTRRSASNPTRAPTPNPRPSRRRRPPRPTSRSNCARPSVTRWSTRQMPAARCRPMPW